MFAVPQKTAPLEQPGAGSVSVAATSAWKGMLVGVVERSVALDYRLGFRFSKAERRGRAR